MEGRVRFRVAVAARLELANSLEDVTDAGDRGEKTGEINGNIEEIEAGLPATNGDRVGEKVHLQHDQGKGRHLADRRDFSGPTWADVNLAVDELDGDDARDDDHVARDDEDSEPDGQLVSPIAHAQGDDAGEEQPFIGDRIEHHPELAALIISAGNISIEAVTGGRDQEDQDRAPALPFLRIVAGDAAAIIDG